MKYKVGQKVRIKSREWYDTNKNSDGNINGCPFCSFMSDMSKMCGNIYEISNVDNVTETYRINNWWFCDDYIEGLASEEKPLISTDLIKDIAEVIKTHNLGVSISENEGKLIIEPLEVEKEEDLPIDTPCMCKDKSGEYWVLRYYAYKGRVFVNGNKNDGEDKTAKFDYTIACSQFNFENPEESLQYNIVKNNQ